MTIWIVRDRKYMSLLEICSSKTIAENFIREHGRENEWFYQEKLVRSE